jgi:putative tryptophan/tyrosine transport system substrate-binding protein
MMHSVCDPTTDGGPTKILHCTSADLVTALRYAASLPSGGDLMELDQLKRREFITLLGGGVAAWPLAAHAQGATPVIGFLSAASSGPFAHFTAAFRQGLQALGYVEGKNVAVDYRWAEGQYDRLPELATDLVRRNVAVIVATGGPASGLAAKAATVTTPIVFIHALDPVKAGFVASLNRPGGNTTGVYLFTSALEPKKLELLHEVVPKAVVIGVLTNPRNPNAETISKDLQTAAGKLGLQIQLVHAAVETEFDAAFTSLVQQGAGALVVAADPFFNARREELVTLAARHAIPAIYEWREFAAAGGLMSYGTILADAYRQVGVYTGRILKGEKPADLPVVQPARFELVINLKTAKALGLQIPDKLLALADAVIE